MSSRPRIVLLDHFKENADAVRLLAEHFDILWAPSEADVARMMTSVAGAGCEMPPLIADGQSEPDVLSSQQVLDRLPNGVAIVHHDLSILWHNRPFAALADGNVHAGALVFEALGCEDLENSGDSPFSDCLAGASHAMARLQLRSGKHIELTVQTIPEFSHRDRIEMLCLTRDVTSEVRQRHKLLAIHRAGLELSHLTPNELATMSMAERVELLKANIVQYSQNILDFKNLEIRLLEPKSRRLAALLAVGMVAPAVERELFAEPVGNGVTGYVAATGKSYRCDDVLKDPLYIEGALDARSSLTVPLFYRDRVIGTFNVESPEPKHFTESDREFLEIFAGEIAVALNTLQLLQAEKLFGGSAGVEEILNKVSLPADEIVADGSRLLDFLQRPTIEINPARDAAKRVLDNAELIKASIQQVGKTFPGLEEAWPPAPPIATRLAGRRVLVIDADPAIRISAHRLLGRVGCMVDTARDAREALILARSIGYDLALSDIRLPDVNGYELFCQLREQCPQMPIALMTGFGYDASHSIVKARQQGLRVVLYKPFRFDRLCESIRDALEAPTSATTVVTRPAQNDRIPSI